MADRIEELPHVEGLLEANGRSIEARFRVRGAEENGQSCGLEQIVAPLDELLAADAGHVVIEHDDVRSPLAKAVERLLGVRRGLHLEARDDEALADHGADVRIIVDHEDTSRGAILSAWGSLMLMPIRGYQEACSSRGDPYITTRRQGIGCSCEQRAPAGLVGTERNRALLPRDASRAARARTASMTSDTRALGELELRDVSGAPVRVGTAWARGPAALVFLRHFG